MIIGLTGKYCAGKNLVAAILEKRGLPVLDVDKLGHKVLETEKETIFAQFGSDLKNTDGSVNKRLLGQRTFGKPEKLASLEAIVHPPVNRLVDEWIANGDRACVINAALLHRAAIFSRLDKIILVTAPFLTRFFRARRRDKLSWKAILLRFNSQKDFNTQYLVKKAEIYKVENPGLSGSRNLHKKLECRIDKFIEGIR
jgi:dephospho-CoA kinase